MFGFRPVGEFDVASQALVSSNLKFISTYIFGLFFSWPQLNCFSIGAISAFLAGLIFSATFSVLSAHHSSFFPDDQFGSTCPLPFSTAVFVSLSWTTSFICLPAVLLTVVPWTMQARLLTAVLRLPFGI